MSGALNLPVSPPAGAVGGDGALQRGAGALQSGAFPSGSPLRMGRAGASGLPAHPGAASIPAACCSMQSAAQKLIACLKYKPFPLGEQPEELPRIAVAGDVFRPPLRTRRDLWASGESGGWGNP